MFPNLLQTKLPLEVLGQVVHDVVASWYMLDNYALLPFGVLLLNCQVWLPFVFLPCIVPRWRRRWHQVPGYSSVHNLISRHMFLLSLTIFALVVEGLLRLTTIFGMEFAFSKTSIYLGVRMFGLTQAFIITVLVRLYFTGSNKTTRDIGSLGCLCLRATTWETGFPLQPSALL